MFFDASSGLVLAFVRGSRDGLISKRQARTVASNSFNHQRSNFATAHVLLLSCSSYVLEYVTDVAMNMDNSLEYHGRSLREMTYHRLSLVVAMIHL